MGARSVELEKDVDHGIDGKSLFRAVPKASRAEQTIIQVKGGKTGVKNVRDLCGVLDREKAGMAVLTSLQPPTRDGGRSREGRFLRAQDPSGVNSLHRRHLHPNPICKCSNRSRLRDPHRVHMGAPPRWHRQNTVGAGRT